MEADGSSETNRREVLHAAATSATLLVGGATTSSPASAQEGISPEEQTKYDEDSDPPRMRVNLLGYEGSDRTAVDQFYDGLNSVLANLFEEADGQFPITLRKYYTDVRDYRCNDDTRDELDWIEENISEPGTYIWVSPCGFDSAGTSFTKNGWEEPGLAYVDQAEAEKGFDKNTGSIAAHEAFHGFLFEGSPLLPKLVNSDEWGGHDPHYLGNTVLDESRGIDGMYVPTVMADSYSLDDDAPNPHDVGQCASGESGTNFSHKLSWCTVRALRAAHRYSQGDEDCKDLDVGTVCDVNGDGVYRDVTGDGSVGQGDVAEFFSKQHRDEWKQPSMFDFSGNGAVTHGDYVELADYVAMS